MSDVTTFNRAMGAVIRRHRRALGHSQTALGDVLGVSFQQIQKFEKGANGVGAHYLPKIATVFGISVAQLYEQAGAKPETHSPADDDAFMAAHYVRKMSAPVRAALIPYLQSIVYQKGRAA